MKVFLMHRGRDFDWQAKLPANEQALTQDLELNTLLDAMARGDRFLLEVAKKAVLLSLKDPEEIVYRQQVLGDCLKQSAIVREIYELAVEAIDAEKKVWYSSEYMDVVGRLDPDTGKVIEYPLPRAENSMRDFFRDDKGRMWFGSPANDRVGYFQLAN